MVKKYGSILLIVIMAVFAFVLLFNLYKVANGNELSPTIEGAAVIHVKNTSVDVLAVVNTYGLMSKIILEYGETSEYSNKIYMIQKYPNIKEKQSIYTGHLKLLEVNTPYHYRIAVITEDSKFYSKDHMFLTTADESL